MKADLITSGGKVAFILQSTYEIFRGTACENTVKALGPNADSKGGSLYKIRQRTTFAELYSLINCVCGPQGLLLGNSPKTTPLKGD